MEMEIMFPGFIVPAVFSSNMLKDSEGKDKHGTSPSPCLAEVTVCWADCHLSAAPYQEDCDGMTPTVPLSTEDVSLTNRNLVVDWL